MLVQKGGNPASSQSSGHGHLRNVANEAARGRRYAWSAPIMYMRPLALVPARYGSSISSAVASLDGYTFLISGVYETEGCLLPSTYAAASAAETTDMSSPGGNTPAPRSGGVLSLVSYCTTNVNAVDTERRASNAAYVPIEFANTTFIAAFTRGWTPG